MKTLTSHHILKLFILSRCEQFLVQANVSLYVIHLSVRLIISSQHSLLLYCLYAHRVETSCWKLIHVTVFVFTLNIIYAPEAFRTNGNFYLEICRTKSRQIMREIKTTSLTNESMLLISSFVP